MPSVHWDERTVALEPDVLAQALAAFARVVGDAHVVTDPARVAALGRATVPGARAPAAAVYPASTAEVAEVVRLAADLRVPLWPCSRGRNWGYGSATPFLAGTVLLHLERLDRIIEVNRELAYAVIEPGVTYRQLRAHLEREHPDLWCDCSDGPPDGSVVGNALERGLGVTAYCDHFATLCGLEVVLADGSVVRTGGGEPGHCATWNTHKWGLGPYVEGLFSQSNFGVVTAAGVWLLRRPQAFVSFTFDLARDADLPRLVDVVREMLLEGVLAPGIHLVNDIVALAVVAQYPPELVATHTRLPDAVLAELRARYTIPGWGFGGGIMGTRGHVRAATRELRRRLRGLGRLTVLTEPRVRMLTAFGRWYAGLERAPWLHRAVRRAFRAVSGKSPELLPLLPHVHSVMQGRPSDYFVRHAYFRSALPKPERADPDRDDVGIIWLAPLAPCTGVATNAVVELCRAAFERAGFDFYAALLHENSRSIIVLLAIFYQKADAAETQRAEALYRELSASLAQHGYQQYRTGTLGMEGLFRSAPAYAAMIRRVKHALDPHGILAPGKTPP